ncbi:MAG: alpha/beta fold hydrolase [Ilumatobacteraceae bacterium]
MTIEDPAIERAYAATRAGRIHYVHAGDGPPVLLLHQTPRSWDEFRDVVPLLAATHHVYAMDSLGFGESFKPDHPMSIEKCGEAVIAFVDAIGLERFSLVGHHTGGIIAVEVAGNHPERIDKLVLSGTTCPDGEGRHRDWPAIDTVEYASDGSHLAALYLKRASYYPPDRPDLLDRLVLDCLRVGLDRAEEGHDAVNSFKIEVPLKGIRAPTLLLCGVEDWAAYPEQDKLASYLPGCQRVEIPGAGVPLPDHMPQAFADAVLAFLDAP